MSTDFNKSIALLVFLVSLGIVVLEVSFRWIDDDKKGLS